RCNSCRHCDEHAQLAHRVGSPFLLLGSHRLCNPIYGGLAVSSFARVEYPDDRHPDDCCRAVLEVMSAFGPYQTWARALHMSAFGGEADILMLKEKDRLATAFPKFDLMF